jgi:mono/diheme cytochrome c family protein
LLRGLSVIRRWEDRRVMSRCRLALLVACAVVALPLAGCSDRWNAGPLHYVDNEALTKEIKGKTSLAGKPVFQGKIRKALADVFGESPQRIKVPAGSGLREGGLYLATYMQEGAGPQTKYYRLYQDPSITTPAKIAGTEAAGLKPQAGGYALYRRNCLHCHGVSGAGDGPTAPFLYPPPRDYRRGIFKFTSTPYMKPPHRNDLRRTITEGLHGTSMPAFAPLMTGPEIEQVIDYVMFLSMRGQTELALIEEAAIADETDAGALSDEVVKTVVQGVLDNWKVAQTTVVNPPSPRTPSTPLSVLRGRDLFLKSDCKDCHGTLALGDGTSFVSQDIFNDVVFGGNPSERQARIPAKVKDTWELKLDEWGNPLRPANLNLGRYKGGRRPLDLYWRIAKGINGAQMPGHFPSIDDKQIWDLVNFVLALPYEPELLRDAPAVAASPALASSAVARP